MKSKILSLFLVSLLLIFSVVSVVAVDVSAPVSPLAGGNNQFNGVLESGSFNTTNGNFFVNAKSQVSVKYVPVVENTLYFCNYSIFAVAYYNKDLKYLGYDLPNGLSFTSFKQASYIKIVFETSELTDTNIMLSLEENSPYEPWFAYEEPTEPITEPPTEEKTEPKTEKPTESMTEKVIETDEEVLNRLDVLINRNDMLVTILLVIIGFTVALVVLILLYKFIRLAF